MSSKGCFLVQSVPPGCVSGGGGRRASGPLLKGHQAICKGSPSWSPRVPPPHASAWVQSLEAGAWGPRHSDSRSRSGACLRSSAPLSAAGSQRTRRRGFGALGDGAAAWVLGLPPRGRRRPVGWRNGQVSGWEGSGCCPHGLRPAPAPGVAWDTEHQRGSSCPQLEGTLSARLLFGGHGGHGAGAAQAQRALPIKDTGGRCLPACRCHLVGRQG